MTTVLIDNLISIRKSLLTVKLDGTEELVSVKLKTEAEINLGTRPKAIEIELWGKTACIVLSSWPESFGLQNYLSKEELEKTPEELVLITLSTVYNQLVSTAAKVLSTNVKLIKYANINRFKHSVYFSLNLTDGSKVDCGLMFNGALLQHLIPLIKKMPMNSVLSSLDIVSPLYLEFGSSLLTTKEMNDIELGDIVMIDSSRYHNKDNMRLRLASNQAFWIKRQEGTLSYLVFEESKVEKSKIEKSISLKDIPLIMTFDLGEISISLVEIEKIGVGYTLNLDKGFNDLVTIRVNNQSIGCGDLVDIGGKAGIRVTQLAELK